MSKRFVQCAIVAALSYSAASTALAEPQACHTLVAASYFAQPAATQALKSSTDTMSRQFSTEFLQKLAQTSRLKIKLVSAEQDTALAEVQSGRIDLIIGVDQQAAQDHHLDYLAPAYMQKKYGLWVRVGEHRTLKQWPELLGLRGVRVVPPQRLVDFDLQAQLFNWPVRTAQSLEQAVERVLAGRSDYLVAEEQGMRDYLRQHNLLRRFELMEQPVHTQSLYVALAKDSACNTAELRQKLSQSLERLLKPER